MKIIKIQFGSPKVYTYLLDFKVKEVPKKGDILKHIAGATEKGAYYDNVKVIDIQNVDKLPPIVTSVLCTFKFKNGNIGCNFNKLSDDTLIKLRGGTEATISIKNDTPTGKIVADAVREYLRIGYKAWCAKHNKGGQTNDQ